MEFLLLIVFGVGVIIFIAVLGARARTRDQLAKAFHALARKHHGIYRQTGRYTQFVEFRRGQIQYRIEIAKTHRFFWRYSIVFTITGWGDSGVDVRIKPRRRLLDRLRWSSVGSGNWGFNFRFLVRGGPKDRLRQLLAAGVQARLRGLVGAAHGKALQVELHENRFCVSRRGWLLPSALLDRYCIAVIGVCDEMIGVLEVGIDFDVTSDQPIAAAICKICGDELQIEIVYCRKCDTPHHKDCWVFNGECSTYACGERRYRRARPRSLTVAERQALES